MSKKKNPPPYDLDLDPSKLLIKLLELHADNAVSFTGYIGHKVHLNGKPTIEFYPNIFELTKHIIIPIEDILHVEKDPDSKPPFEAKIIWVKAESNIVIKKTPPPPLKATNGGMPIQAGGLQIIIGQEAAMTNIRQPICVRCT